MNHNTPPATLLTTAAVTLLAASFARAADQPVDLATWDKEPAAFAGARITAGKATLTSNNSADWAFLLNQEATADGELAATVTILEPAKNFRFFGQGWSAWPSPTWSDGGFEAALLLRAGKEPVTSPPGIPPGKIAPRPVGYRVQVSHKYQEIALVKYPAGGYLQSVSCAIKLNQPHRLTAQLRGNQISVRIDGVEKIRYQDDVLPLEKGRFGLGVSSAATVVVEGVTLVSKPAAPRAKALEKHEPQFAVRAWLGGRRWVFDGKEPICQLPYQQKHTGTYFTQVVDNVKLLPGYRPMMNWNGHWDIANQGAFPAGASKGTEAEVTGGGPTLTASWTGKQHDGRFATRTKLTIGFDPQRGTYTYDVDTELEVLAEFRFGYGYDFEHHTPLDPFGWQYLLFKGEGGTLYRRPVYPIDPGPQNDLYPRNGLKLWYGRHVDKMAVVPAVEYDIPEAGKRKLNTAVCAAFYDTGVSFGPETAKPGTKVHVQYRYTGYPAAEAEALFKESVVYPAPMLDPDQYYLFTADQWPKLTFNNFAPLSETWIYGRNPFKTGHNVRPSYELARNTGVGSGFAIKLGPGAYGAAPLPTPTPLPPGRWMLTAQCRSDNTHGPGGRFEVKLTQGKTGKSLKQETHYVGNGSFDWKALGFVFEVPADVGGLTLGFGNGGTGDVYFAEVEFKRLEDGARPPAWVAAAANATVPKVEPAPAGAIADYRMEEQKGLHVLNYAAGPLEMLELANLEWIVEDDRPALRFADNTTGRASYPRAGNIDLSYFRHASYEKKQLLPVAIAGRHGGGFELKAFTLSTFIKPAAQMGKATHGGKGDIAGLGARRVIVRLLGQQAPYRLSASLNVGENFTATEKIEAGRWYHVALTGVPTDDKKWRIRLYLDGKLVQVGVSKQLEAPMSISPSLILGAELFYLHDAYYRGLIGRTLIFDRALAEREVAELAGAWRAPHKEERE
jgi:hypothetical protein